MAHTRVDELTILLILVALALIAYYADLFGWDPNDRFDGPTSGGLAPALLFLGLGLLAAFHFDLITTDVLAEEYGRAAYGLSEAWTDLELPSKQDAWKQLGELPARALRGFQLIADAIAQAIGSPEATPAVATPPPTAQ